MKRNIWIVILKHSHYMYIETHDNYTDSLPSPIRLMHISSGVILYILRTMHARMPFVNETYLRLVQLSWQFLAEVSFEVFIQMIKTYHILLSNMRFYIER